MISNKHDTALQALLRISYCKILIKKIISVKVICICWQLNRAILVSTSTCKMEMLIAKNALLKSKTFKSKVSGSLKFLESNMQRL